MNVNMRDLYNNLECHKVNNGMLDSMLIQKHEKIQTLSSNVQVQVHEWNEDCNFWVREVIVVIENVFEHHHGSSYEWIKHHV